MQRYAWLPVLVGALTLNLPGRSLPAAAVPPSNSANPPALASVLPTTALSAAGTTAAPTVWWGTLEVARGGTDLVTVAISPQPGGGPHFPTPVSGRRWTVFGTWTRVCSAQQNLVAGTIGSDGKVALAFWVPGTPPTDQQLAVGVVAADSNGRLHGSVTVVQGVDLNDTFSFVLGHQ